jgi:hypothetical protein
VPRLGRALIGFAYAGATVAAGTLPDPIEASLKIMSKQPFVMTPKNYPRPLKVFGEHAAALVWRSSINSLLCTVRPS